MNSNKIYIVSSQIVAVILLIIAAYVLLFTGDQVSQKSPKIVNILGQYAADFSDDRVLVGAAHNIFIGRVIDKAGNKERGIGAETQYDVEVLENIKGELKGHVTVNQRGGEKGEIVYMFNSDEHASSDVINDYFLQPGKTYLMMTRYSQVENWHTLSPHPNAKKLISDSASTPEEIHARLEVEPRIAEVKSAYENEIVIEADVKTGNARNSYESVKANREQASKEVEVSEQ